MLVSKHSLSPGVENRSHFLTAVFSLGYFVLALEGNFKLLIEEKFLLGTAFWTKFLPFNFFPSEIVAYLLGSIYLVWYVITKFENLAVKKWIWLLCALVAFGALQLIRGHMAYSSETGNEAFNQFKTSIFRLVYVIPIFFGIASVNLEKMLGQVMVLCTPLAIFNIIVGLMGMLGVAERDAWYFPNFTGCQLLLLPSAYAMLRCIQRPAFVVVVCAFLLTLGALAPLQKPALFSFIVLIVAAPFAASLIKRNRMMHNARTNSILPTLVGVGVITAVVLVGVFFVSSLGDGQGLRYLENRIFKTDAQTIHRDLSSGRFEMWRWALSQWLSNPLLGTGFGRQFLGISATGEFKSLPVHNDYLQILYQTGIVGMGLYLLFIFEAVRNLPRTVAHLDPSVVLGATSVALWLWVMLISNMVGHSTGVQSASFAFAFALAVQLRLSDMVGKPRTT